MRNFQMYQLNRTRGEPMGMISSTWPLNQHRQEATFSQTTIFGNSNLPLQVTTGHGDYLARIVTTVLSGFMDIFHLQYPTKGMNSLTKPEFCLGIIH